MTIEEFRDYCLSFEGVTEKMPFGKFAARYDSILVFYVMGHMFCFIDIEDFSYADVRCSPETIDELRASRCSVSSPINRSLKHWLQIDFGGDVSTDELLKLVEEAYWIVRRRYTKKSKDNEKNRKA